MKKPTLLVLAACLTGLTACGITKQFSTTTKSGKEEPTMLLTLLPQDTLEAGKTVTVMAKLNRKGGGHHIVTDADLETVHEQKFHLLVADPTLTDYQHIHPQQSDTPGVWRFSFTPRFAGGYRAWADVTPAATRKQEFVAGDLGNPHGSRIDKTETREASVGGYHFTLSFDKAPVAGGMSMGSIRITVKNGDPVTELEPVMGARAHIVGFYDNFRTVVHTHEMSGHGHEHAHGTDIMFHLEPARSGFIRLFAQFRIGGKDLYVPFGILIPSPLEGEG